MYLDLHWKTHTQERPYVYELCNKAFSQKSSLSCDMCGKTFGIKMYLGVHILTHLASGMTFVTYLNVVQQQRTVINGSE